MRTIVALWHAFWQSFEVQRAWVEKLCLGAVLRGVPVFMKSSLKTVVNTPLNQQYPKAMQLEDKTP